MKYMQTKINGTVWVNIDVGLTEMCYLKNPRN